MPQAYFYFCSPWAQSSAQMLPVNWPKQREKYSLLNDIYGALVLLVNPSAEL